MPEDVTERVKTFNAILAKLVQELTQSPKTILLADLYGCVKSTDDDLMGGVNEVPIVRDDEGGSTECGSSEQKGEHNQEATGGHWIRRLCKMTATVLRDAGVCKESGTDRAFWPQLTDGTDRLTV